MRASIIDFMCVHCGEHNQFKVPMVKVVLFNAERERAERAETALVTLHRELGEELSCEMEGCENKTREPTNHPDTGGPICPSCAVNVAYELGCERRSQ